MTNARGDSKSHSSRSGAEEAKNSEQKVTREELIKMSSNSMSYYVLLEISSSATLQEIKAAYRRKALKCHPDKNPDYKNEAEAAFKRLANAFETLSDQNKRAIYDSYLASSQQQQETKDDFKAHREEAKEEHKSRHRRRRAHKQSPRNAREEDYMNSEWVEPDISNERAQELFDKLNEVITEIIREEIRRKDLGIILANDVAEGKWDKVSDLIKQGAKLNQLSSRGYSALQHAIYSSSNAHCEFLINVGADINVKDHNGYTALHHTVFTNNVELCKILIRAGAERHHRGDAKTGTPLHHAINNNAVSSEIKELLANNPTEYRWLFGKYKSHDVKDINDDTPLHLAIRSGQFDLAILLLSKGADMDIKNKREETSFRLGLNSGNDELLNVISNIFYYRKQEEERKNQSGCRIM